MEELRIVTHENNRQLENIDLSDADSNNEKSGDELPIEFQSDEFRIESQIIMIAETLGPTLHGATLVKLPGLGTTIQIGQLALSGVDQ
ncbi:5318_t:CDS:2 [Ambispora leptoticha]|uniref:5318_t:CDS:1 n=1 Tax=Ambispora leptoticha TaxID=144679 RepID=A0A9N8WMN3_9GLOM|nr:5318_t:CDS:2 [Ambispora leptoticha]